MASTQTQNVFTYSQDQSNAAWTKTNLSVVAAPAVPDPLGGVSTYNLVEAVTVSTTSRISQAAPGGTSGLTVGKVVTFSAFVKAKERTWAAIYGRGGGCGTYINLATGAAGTFGGTSYINSGIENYSNGWYRVFVTYVDDGNGCVVYIAAGDLGATYSGNGTSGIYIFGEQLELGAQMSSYRRVDATPYEKSSRNQVAQKQNLLAQSNKFATTPWTNATGVTTANNTTDVADPAGTNTASKITYDGSGGVAGFRIYQTIGNYPAGVVVTISFWGRVLSGTRSMVINTNLGGASNITLTTTWQKFVLTAPPTNAGTLQFVLYDGAGVNTAGSWYMYQAQEVFGNNLGGYVDTTSTSFNEGNIRSKAGTRLTVAQGQNLAPYSNTFTNVVYAKVGTVAAGTADTLDPFGSSNATKYTDTSDGGSTIHYVFQTPAAVVGKTYTNSMYLKAGTLSWVSVFSNVGANSVYFNLSNGTIGTQTNAVGKIVSVGNGWYRCSITYSATTVGPALGFYPASADGGISYTGTGTGTLYVYAMQMVNANWAGVYTPTTAALINTGNIRNLAGTRLVA